MAMWRSRPRGAGNKRRRPPRRPAGATLILKQTIEIDATGQREVTLPCILILGDRAAFRHLSRYFAWLADREAVLSDVVAGDPDDHQHFNFPEPQFDPLVSDRVTFRFGLLDARNRKAAMRKYGIKRATARRGPTEVGVARTLKTRRGRGEK